MKRHFATTKQRFSKLKQRKKKLQRRFIEIKKARVILAFCVFGPTPPRQAGGVPRGFP